MSLRFIFPALLALVPAFGPSLSAQEAVLPELRGDLLGQFNASAQKLVMLADAMPADTYGWQPAEGVYTVARVYAHIARYNYMYPDQNMGVDAPMPYDAMEATLTGKAEVTEALRVSMEHVRTVVEGMSEAELAERTTLYGRDVPKWAVMLQLVTHMNEHLGQAIAYARMNGVTPPWSR